jgi:hypothetical protein
MLWTYQGYYDRFHFYYLLNRNSLSIQNSQKYGAIQLLSGRALTDFILAISCHGKLSLTGQKRGKVNRTKTELGGNQQ